MAHYNGMVLSLAKDEARRQAFYQQLASFNPDSLPIAITTFEAIDGSTEAGRSFLEANFDFKKAQAVYGRPITYGEAACALSHLAIIRHLANEPRYAVILEDDAKFSSDFPKLAQVLDASNHDVVVFGESKVRKFKGKNKYRRENPLQFFAQRIGNLKLGVIFSFYTPGTVGYALSKRLVAKILAYTQHSQVFWLADDFDRIIAAVTNPQLPSNQSNATSNFTIGFVYPRLVIEDMSLRSHLEAERRRLIDIAEGKVAKRSLFQRLTPKFYFVGILKRRYLAWREQRPFDKDVFGE